MRPTSEQSAAGRLGPAALPETPDVHGAYPRLGQPQLRTLVTEGERRPTTGGEVLIQAGQRSDTFYVLLSGQAVVLRAETERGRARRRDSSACMAPAASSANSAPSPDRSSSSPPASTYRERLLPCRPSGCGEWSCTTRSWAT